MITEEIRRIENGERTFDDPRERKRTVPLEVLVLGMPRTGTLCTHPFAFGQHLGPLGIIAPSADVAAREPYSPS